MITSLLLAAALWPAEAVQECQPDDATKMLGLAKTTAGEFLYCEKISSPDTRELHLDYIRHNTLFATKRLNFQHSLLMPDVQQDDLRFGELRHSHHADNKIFLQYRANTGKKIANTSVNVDDVDIVDAGFDNFIRANWDQLQTGSPISVSFASIPHQKILPLRIRNQPLQKCTSQADTEGAFCFLVEIDNALLRLVLGNIHLTYDQQRRLIKYEGIVNIEDDKQNSQTAIIRYFYLPEATPQPTIN